jgi:LysR family glycine cleavage system transcriptional activator
VEDSIRGPNWALLTHRDSEQDPMARSFSEWLLAELARSGINQQPEHD